jgi:transaldolase
MLESLRTRIFADGADLARMIELASDPYVRGFTTNPTLMRKAGQSDYTMFAKSVLAEITDLPISFEVLADDAEGIESEARRIASWGDNVFVKVPVTTTLRQPLAPVIQRLSGDGVQVNVTAVFTPEQVETVTAALSGGAASYVSVFAGRIADAGVDPIPIMKTALEIIADVPTVELIWASPREVLNVIQASEIGCHVITLTHDLLAKLPLLGRDLEAFSLDTVKMFHSDAVAAGLTL